MIDLEKCRCNENKFRWTVEFVSDAPEGYVSEIYQVRMCEYCARKYIHEYSEGDD
jgi:redox-regulated HSP33 family molecular chaperone